LRLLVVFVASTLALALVPGGLGAPRAGAARATAPATAQAALAKRIRAVVYAWSARLNANDNAGLARLFAVPAVVIQGPYVYRLLTRALVAEWYSSLPCSGHILSVSVKGRYATAMFRLGNRGAQPCDAPGTLAAARFEIVGGKIKTWEQLPVPTKKQPAPASGPLA
jgi:hypothetical protein